MQDFVIGSPPSTLIVPPFVGTDEKVNCRKAVREATLGCPGGPQIGNRPVGTDVPGGPQKAQRTDEPSVPFYEKGGTAKQVTDFFA